MSIEMLPRDAEGRRLLAGRICALRDRARARGDRGTEVTCEMALDPGASLGLRLAAIEECVRLLADEGAAGGE